MSTITKINLNHIVSVKIYPKHPNYKFTYQAIPRSIFDFFKKKERVYGFFIVDAFTNVHISSDEWLKKILEEENSYVDGNEIYENPHIVIRMSNQTSTTKYFSDLDSLENFISENGLNDKATWLTI